MVGNFSSFARLPRADLLEASLREFLSECRHQLGHLGVELVDDGEEALVAPDVEVSWQLPDDPMPVAIDRQMFRRVIVNLVRNGVEAIRGARLGALEGGPRGHVCVGAQITGDGVENPRVEDDGPGVPAESRERVFDPYVTTKSEGTGLGLAIVKKIVVEHNGTIMVRRSERLGGAAFVVTLPPPHSLAIAAARDGERRDVPPAPSSRRAV